MHTDKPGRFSLKTPQRQTYTSADLPAVQPEATNVSDYDADQGGGVMWCLRRRAADVRCLVFAQSSPVEARVMHDGDVVVTEVFQEEWMALDWARVYGDRLRAQGWLDVPETPAHVV